MFRRGAEFSDAVLRPSEIAEDRESWHGRRGAVVETAATIARVGGEARAGDAQVGEDASDLDVEGAVREGVGGASTQSTASSSSATKSVSACGGETAEMCAIHRRAIRGIVRRAEWAEEGFAWFELHQAALRGC